MSYNCCSANFSSHSFVGYLHYPSSPCGSSFPSNLVYSPDLCSPSTCQLGSSLYSDFQENCHEPTSIRTSYVVSSPCQTSCYCPRTSLLCSPCQTTYSGSLGFGSSSCRSLGYGSSGFRPLSYRGCGFGYGFSRPTYLASRSCQSSCYRPIYRSTFCRSTC
ncbi:keratin-associated protein 13-2-like [Lemur catta]|uniref:keratin-associated protein 13-2-like n=1 Tax=Lemur catta TaxID=9447 RepID=UPI001E2672F4|nr:keratin-associated protein 13-2-like [Lemur catta]